MSQANIKSIYPSPGIHTETNEIAGLGKVQHSPILPAFHLQRTDLPHVRAPGQKSVRFHEGEKLQTSPSERDQANCTAGMFYFFP